MMASSKVLLLVTALALIMLVSSSPFHSGIAAETRKISKRSLSITPDGCCCPNCYRGCTCCCAK